MRLFQVVLRVFCVFLEVYKNLRIFINLKNKLWNLKKKVFEPPKKACKKNEEPSVCQHSGFIERVRCIESGKTEPRACEKLPKYQSQLFWRFETFPFIFSKISSLKVFGKSFAKHLNLWSSYNFNIFFYLNERKIKRKVAIHLSPASL